MGLILRFLQVWRETSKQAKPLKGNNQFQCQAFFMYHELASMTMTWR